MQKKRHPFFVGLALLCVAQGAMAIGWARAQQSAVLGQQLDFTAALRLDPGDSVAAGCVGAEVLVGDQRLPAGSLRISVEGGTPDVLNLRVQSSVAVDEPVVAVTLSIGCPARMSRRFVLLADPPLLQPSAAATLVVAAAPAAAESINAGAAGSGGTPGAAVPALATGAVARGGSTGARPGAQTTARIATRGEAARPDAVSAALQPGAAPPARAASARRARPPVAAASAVAASPAPEPAARLRLDVSEPAAAAPLPLSAAAKAVDDALQAVAAAASAARAAASAASAADDRIARLERSLNDVRAEAKANRDLLTQMRERADAGASATRWVPLLLLVLLALALLAAWLGMRLRSLQSDRVSSWRRAAAEPPAHRPAVPTSQLPMVTSELHLPTGPGSVPSAGAAAWPPTSQTQPPLAASTLGPTTLNPSTLPAGRLAGSAPEPLGARVEHAPYERTQVLAPQPQRPDGSVAGRDVSIEELIDLEQQAEFFIVLGQDDAAIDLLVDHLRTTGGGSPLPYLKLLEMYRRRGEREAYERTRARFNLRFNAYAPDWDSDLQQGRALDDYVGVLPRLQQVWPRPLDAMAELEALLFRKSRGDLFELPAYREVLFLYALARDLTDREAADTGTVDLLLPLSDGGEFSATSPHPYLGLEHDSVFDAMGDDRPTAPVDLDLSQPDGPALVDGSPARR